MPFGGLVEIPRIYAVVEAVGFLQESGLGGVHTAVVVGVLEGVLEGGGGNIVVDSLGRLWGGVGTVAAEGEGKTVVAEDRRGRMDSSDREVLNGKKVGVSCRSGEGG